MFDRRPLFDRRQFLAAAAAVPAATALGAHAQSAKSTLILGLALEPPTLDPTASAASSIAEVTLYNVYETLTKIHQDGSVGPLLAQSWEMAADLQSCTLRLRAGVRFHNGQPFDANTVAFSLQRAASDKSTNKDREQFAAMRAEVIDALTVRLHLATPMPDLLFILGQATAIMVEPKSAATNATAPVGTGPYRLAAWQKGASVTLQAWDEHRDAARLRIRQAVFRFIPDPAAQMAALLAGDIDAFPRSATRNVAHFKGNPRYQVLVGNSRSKTLLAINHARKPLGDVRVRRAIAAAIDRKMFIEGAADGYGVPIGSHYVPGAFAYVDTTGINPFDPARARALLKEAGVALPLKLTMTVPPAAYARQGSEIIAAQLAQVGIELKLQNVEWAQWLAGTYGKKQYDLTIISHVEPLDLDNFTRRDYYWGYHNAAFDALYAQIQRTAEPNERTRLLARAQFLLAEDCVHAWLYQPQWVTVADKRLRGLWRHMPIFANELAAMYWV